MRKEYGIERMSCRVFGTPVTPVFGCSVLRQAGHALVASVLKRTKEESTWCHGIYLLKARAVRGFA